MINPKFKYRITPNNIKDLEDNEIFVFGSNLRGVHGAGAAYTAFRKFGAIPNVGYGLQGNSYALPTKGHKIETLPLATIRKYILDFIEFAKENPEYTFLVTKIGCNLAGYSVSSIAPLFIDATEVKNIYLPEEFWIEIGKLKVI